MSASSPEDLAEVLRDSLIAAKMLSSTRWGAMRVSIVTATAIGLGTAPMGILVGVATAAVTDNMYMTNNLAIECYDGTSGTGIFCQTDNATLTVHRQNSISLTGKGKIADALVSYDNTDLNVHYHGNAVEYSGSTETDIIYQQSTAGLSASADGMAWCDDALSNYPLQNYRCDQHYVRFRSDTPGRALACHETGHAVGLTHGDQASPTLSKADDRLGCMTTPVETYQLRDNNRDNINATY